MKRIDTYIQEKLHINKDVKVHNYFPKDKHELIQCIKEKIDKEGLGTEDNPLDLNDIYTGDITDMSFLFSNMSVIGDLSKNGYFDISKWNVSNVINMAHMFENSEFNGDISKWDVSRVEKINFMFYKSSFNGDISKWKINNIKYKDYVFTNSPLQNNPPKWYKS